MVNEIYTLVEAGSRNLIKLDVAANNIANATTAGFKSDRVFFNLLTRDVSENSAVTPAFSSIVKIDFNPGNLQRTGNSLDLAIEGGGYFAVQDKETVYYTKKGNFTLDQAQRLVSMSGHPVLGEGGPITVPSGKVEINQEGEVFVDGNSIGRLRISSFAAESELKKVGDSLFLPPRADAAVKAENVIVRSGFLEMSNVRIIKEMTEMMDQHRIMDIFQKAIHTISDLDKISTSRIGRMA